MIKFIVRTAIPYIISNAVIDADTVQKKDGYYLRIRLEAFDMKIVDWVIKLSDLAPSEPIDVFEAVNEKAEAYRAEVLNKVKADLGSKIQR